MTLGVGGSDAATELTKLTDMSAEIAPIKEQEYLSRIRQAQALMEQNGIDAIYLNAGTNLLYFTGTNWYASERLVGAIIPKQGDIQYICPHFEVATLSQYMTIVGDIHAWHEHESPYKLTSEVINKLCKSSASTEHSITIAMDESTPFFISDGIKQVDSALSLVNADSVISSCRMCKSDNEITILQQAKLMTMAVHKAAAKILRPGITTTEVTEFIDKAHQAVGANSGSYFCIVLFGEDSSFPHGVKTPKALEQGDMVLIDTGCEIEGYHSDITRSYVFGEPNERQRAMWQIEHDAQLAAFSAAKIGTPCKTVDIAARASLAKAGMGPEYQTPGCPHRTGHGIGLDIHEWPYLVQSDETPLAKGMCFSNEPMLVLPNEFGVRLEDHFYMTENGAKWFTEPSPSIDDPFGYNC